MDKIKLTIILTLFVALCTAAYGQVTAGSGTPPQKAALLARNSLQPLVTADEDIKATVRTSYKGTRVYNTSTDKGFPAGEYIWSGTVWKTPEEAEAYARRTAKQPEENKKVSNTEEDK